MHLKQLKRFGKMVLTQATINRSLRWFLSLNIIKAAIPPVQLQRFPVVGMFEAKLWGGQVVRFYSQGEDTIASRLYWHGINAFEPATYQLLKKLLAKTRCFVDVGANTGFYALIAGVTDPQRQVYAFEPVPAIYRYLQRNVEGNRLTNVMVYQGAVTDYVGRIKLYLPQAAMLPTSASTLPGFRVAAAELDCSAITLDAYFEQQGKTNIDLIKIDTEGTEHKVLAGAQRILTECRPALLCEVLQGQTERELQALLDNTDYDYFLITEQGLIRQERIVGNATNLNYLFITPEKFAAFGLSAN